MNSSSMTDTLQLAAWFFATIEFVLAFYVLFLNVRHRANQHMSVLLLIFAISNISLGIFIGAEDANQAQFASYLAAVTNGSIQPMLFIVIIVLLKPEWLRGRWRWAIWLLYVMVVLPLLLVMVDVIFGTELWFTGLTADYPGGYVTRAAYVNGWMASFMSIVGTYLLGTVPIVPLIFIAFFDKKSVAGTRQLAGLLLVTQVSSIVVQVALRDIMGPGVSSLVLSLILIVGYAYAAFQQMVSERRVQRGQLQIRLTALIGGVSVPLFVATSLIVNVRTAAAFRASAIADMGTINHSLKSSVSSWLELNVSALQQVAVLPDMMGMDPQRQKPLLQDIAARHAHVYLASTTDLNGLNVARSDDGALSDYGDRTWFSDIAHQAPWAFQTVIGRTSGQPALVVAVPIRKSDSSVVGVLMLAGTLSDISREVVASRVGMQGFSFIVDGQDLVVAHPDSKVVTELRDFSAYPAVAALRRGKRAKIVFTDEDDRAWVAYVDESDKGWGIVVQRPEAELGAVQRPVQRVSFFIVGLSVILLLVFAWLTIRQSVQPLRSLTRTANDIASGNLASVAAIESEDEIGVLARAFNSMTAQLRELVGGLEENVRERTAILEQRSNYLQASTEVGRTVASILDREQLLAQVVESIRERFQLYYVGLFLVDEVGVAGEPGQWALLRAGTGEAGQTMLERQTRISVGEGVAGWAIANAQSRIASRAEADAVCLLYPELSYTRSEVVLPLRSRGRVLGVLALHSDQLDAFDQDMAVVLQVMADQVAVALDNAELFAEREAALDEVRRAQGQVTREAWGDLLRARTDWGYSYNRRSLLPAQGQWPPEMVRARQTGDSVLWQRDEEPVLSVPVQARGQVIGVLNFDKSEAGVPWTDEEVRLLETLVGRLGEALETAQLYESAQQLAAREQMIGDMAAQFTSALDLDALLQTAVRELGQLPNVAEVSVHIDVPEEA